MNANNEMQDSDSNNSNNVLKPTMYVFVRRDMPWPVIVTQACHAAANASTVDSRGGDEAHATPYIITFGLKTETSLKNALAYVKDLGILCVPFNEPDRNNELTAFSTVVLPNRIKEFRKFQLLKE